MTTSLTIPCIKVCVKTSYTDHEGGEGEREGGEGEREGGKRGRKGGRERRREEGRAWPMYEAGVVKAHHSMVGLEQVS